jgi:hypothetical protein
MTRYTEVWNQSAQFELAELWLIAVDRSAVTSATHEIDQMLSADASTKGSELSEGLRSLIVSPLKVIFAASDDDRIVEVLRVRNG